MKSLAIAIALSLTSVAAYAYESDDYGFPVEDAVTETRDNTPRARNTRFLLRRQRQARRANARLVPVAPVNETFVPSDSVLVSPQN